MLKGLSFTLTSDNRGRRSELFISYKVRWPAREKRFGPVDGLYEHVDKKKLINKKGLPRSFSSFVFAEARMKALDVLNCMFFPRRRYSPHGMYQCGPFLNHECHFLKPSQLIPVRWRLLI